MLSSPFFWQNLGRWQLHWTKFYIGNFSIRNYFIKRSFFLFIKSDTAIIKQSSNTFLWKCSHQLDFVILNEVSFSNIFLVLFLYTWSSKINSIFIVFRTSILFVKLNINYYFSSSISSKSLLNKNSVLNSIWSFKPKLGLRFQW